jgi:transcriptional regulator with XRE-family HTH domain
MSPKELRALREGLGLSRREFAPKLFISEPTLERWERGQGGPREIHHHILRRMQEHLGSGQPLEYFQYDAAAGHAAAELDHEEKQIIIEAMGSMAVGLLEERQSKDGNDWMLKFVPGWAAGEPVDLALFCEGSERPSRPMIDFSLEMKADWGDPSRATERVATICCDHRIGWESTAKGKAQSIVTLYYRLFSAGCNQDAVRHILGNFQSCWRRLKSELLQNRKSPPHSSAQSDLKEAASCRK